MNQCVSIVELALKAQCSEYGDLVTCKPPKPSESNSQTTSRRRSIRKQIKDAQAYLDYQQAYMGTTDNTNTDHDKRSVPSPDKRTPHRSKAGKPSTPKRTPIERSCALIYGKLNQGNNHFLPTKDSIHTSRIHPPPPIEQLTLQSKKDYLKAVKIDKFFSSFLNTFSKVLDFEEPLDKDITLQYLIEQFTNIASTKAAKKIHIKHPKHMFPRVYHSRSRDDRYDKGMTPIENNKINLLPLKSRLDLVAASMISSAKTAITIKSNTNHKLKSPWHALLPLF